MSVTDLIVILWFEALCAWLPSIRLIGLAALSVWRDWVVIHEIFFCGRWESFASRINGFTYKYGIQYFNDIFNIQLRSQVYLCFKYELQLKLTNDLHIV